MHEISAFAQYSYKAGKLAISAVKNGESPQKTAVLAGALIPSASVPMFASIELRRHRKCVAPVAIMTRMNPCRNKLNPNEMWYNWSK
jgi:hypothetical protein